MEEKKEIWEDRTVRLEKIIEVIQSIATGNFDARAEVTMNTDIIDAVATGINMLVEELENGMIGLKYVDERTSEILEIIQKIARGDYTKLCEFREKNDSFDALAIGVNMMIDDIKNNLEKDKQRVSELDKAYTELQAAQAASLNIMEDLDEQRKELSNLNKKLQKEIVEHKRTEEKLKVTMKELERSNSELEQFAYVASHDLQEPLRMISSYMQLLERRYKDKLDTDAKEFINYAVDGATRMQRMINDMLTYSRVGTRGKPFSRTECKKVLKIALMNLKASIETNDSEVTYDTLPTLDVDEMQFSQLFQNLIGNAIKFHGKEKPRIHVSASEKENEWLFSVQDNGIGIDPGNIERIFQIFNRGSISKEFSGTGIGLAVCKKIVERHGGRIWVESELGKGSTFHFTIHKSGDGRE
jgi:light-regulated signal transduction histidine kinase (bacteriophytochrome)